MTAVEINETNFLKEHVKKRISMPDKELNEFVSAFSLKKIQKRQFIVQPEFIAKYRTFVVQGAFRSYVIDKDGVDHTIQFAMEDWWIGDINSFLYRKPATMFVVALENSIVFQLDYEKEVQLKAANYFFESFFRIAAERTASFHQRRIVSALTRTASERYKEFIEMYPNVVQRLPQYALASYLGMTTQFLSKIRRNMATKVNLV